ncbi:hypothetical protein J1TS3_04930 [Siminovitchia fordii]|uniref:Uncharacterized protein n=1 Tax=Siminovitchia fordii TaxID=254759 RepID=A0ABQ4K0R5_9BACI|nr:hypothetical protein J1TS3_04930 [Siminovitchia fordii]
MKKKKGCHRKSVFTGFLDSPFFIHKNGDYFLNTPGLSSRPDVKIADKNAMDTPNNKIVLIIM